MIEIRNLTKIFTYRGGGYHKVFENLNVDFHSGGKYAILGKNGSGKSTLISMIAGVQVPDSGRIIKHGLKTSWPVGFGGNFQGSLTGMENLEFICRIFGKTRKEAKEVIEFVRDWAELNESFYKPVKTYSSGMRARLAFGASMAFDFDFYLLDEVTATGDMFFVQKAQAMLNEKLRKKGFIMVSHAIGELRDICTSFGVIEKKHIVFYDNFRDAFESYKKQA